MLPRKARLKVFAQEYFRRVARLWGFIQKLNRYRLAAIPDCGARMVCCVAQSEFLFRMSQGKTAALPLLCDMPRMDGQPS